MWFRIYYSDGSTYDGNCTEEAYRAPAVGALLVKQEALCNTGGYSIRSATFFCWETYPKDTLRWGGKEDLFGLARYYARQQGPQKVLIGEEVDDVLYQDARARAGSDGYLGGR